MIRARSLSPRVAFVCVGARESAHVAEILSAANVEIAAVVNVDGRRTQRQGCGCSIPALTGKPGAASFAAGPMVLVAPIGEVSGLMEWFWPYLRAGTRWPE